MTVTNGYTDIPTLTNVLGINDGDDDIRLTAAINAASRQIDAHCGRRFWQDADVKVRQYRPEESRFALVDDISTVTGLIVAIDDDDDGTFETELTITEQFVLGPYNALDDVPVRPYCEIHLVDGDVFPQSFARPSLQVTARFGWVAVPDDVAQACVIQAKNMFKAPSGTFTGYQLSVESGVAVRTPSIDPMAAALLEPYRKVLT